jgi:hypothetical protein
MEQAYALVHFLEFTDIEKDYFLTLVEHDRAGTNIPAYLEREGIHMGSPEIVKTITRIIPRINAISGTQVFVRVGTQMQPKDGVVWEPEKTFTVGTDIKVDSMATGRLFTVRFRSDTSRAWSLDGFEIDYQPVSGY